MKRWLTLLACMLYLSPLQAKPLQIFATTPVIYAVLRDLTQNIATIQLQSFGSQGNIVCLHDYLLTPGDLVKIASADLVVMDGGGVESAALLRPIKQAKAEIFELVRHAPSSEVEGHQFLRLDQAAQLAQLLTDKMIEKSTNATQALRDNHALFQQQLKKLMTKGATPAKSTLVLLASEGLHPLLQWLHFTRVHRLAHSETQPLHLAELTQITQEMKQSERTLLLVDDANQKSPLVLQLQGQPRVTRMSINCWQQMQNASYLRCLEESLKQLSMWVAS